MRFLRLGFSLALVALLATPAALAFPMLRTFGGPEGFGTQNLPANDDGSTGAIDLTAAFPGGLVYFGGTYPTFFVNNNGNITFGGALNQFTPTAFPIASQPMIAPFWGDVDTRGAGFPTSNGVWWNVSPGQVVVTWDLVGYYATHTDLENSFQLILSTDPACPGPGNFDVEFRYEQCQWTTGDASGGMNGLGGTPAQVGFDAGNLTDYYSVPESRMPTILDVCTTSNGGAPGDWLFTICDGVITGGCPGAGAPCTVPGQLGVCAHGVNHCAGRGGTVCAQTVHPSMEICDGLDNDCNGAVDDNIAPRACYDGMPATEGVGVCRGGFSSCTSAMFGPCTGEVLPSPEVCDNLDNDCNGHVDDGITPRPCYTGPGGTEGIGVCRAGGETCTAGVFGACVGAVTPTAEVCDGLDNDCNGIIDDGLVNCHPPPPDVITDTGTDAVAVDAPTDVSRSDGHVQLLFEGRSGPLGCACRTTPGPHGSTRGMAAWALVAGVVGARRRRK